MARFFQSLARASLSRGVQPAVAAAFIAFAPALWAAEEAITFQGKTIWVEGVSATNWVGHSELILIYSNAAPDAVNILRTDNPFEARMLLVGGGGAGGGGTTDGWDPGGGGGGGQVVDIENNGYPAGIYNIIVGAGGANTLSRINGENGHPSLITNSTSEIAKALGGGGGGAKANGNGGGMVATGGGSSGRGNSGGIGALGENHKGGNASEVEFAGGGGGAGDFGKDSTQLKAGDGGAGVSSSILNDDGNVSWYGGGGGGGHSAGTQDDKRGIGGIGGGGIGGRRGRHGEDGVPGTGGGGGGGGWGTATYDGQNGGAGGSGIVIIRLTYIEQEMKWEECPGTEGQIRVVNASAIQDPESGDLIITYTNVNSRGGLKFFADSVWASARILAVGGGGGGGFIGVRDSGAGGGGGAGGFIEEAGLTLGGGNEYWIAVGAGGAGGAYNEDAGRDGGNSSVLLKGGKQVMSAAAVGGGGGGAHGAGRNGGSGGGGSCITPGLDERGGDGVQGQGFNGGFGADTYKGAGGGGAGGPGGDARNGVGAGGDGRMSSITGSEIWYAGGGGGAWISDSNGSAGAGGAGGLGGGGNGAGVANNVAMPAQNGDPGTGGGGGGGISHVGAAGETAGRGGDGVVVIRLSNIHTKGIPKPTPKGPFTYDGNVHTGVVESFAYTLSGTPVATNAGDYKVTATLNNPDMTWEGGGKDPVNLEWKITPAPNAISNFYYPGYRVDRLAVHHPTNQFEAIWGKETTIVEYRREDTGNWQLWGETGPSAKGNYEVRVSIPPSSNWAGATNVLAFGTWEKLSDLFSDCVEVTISGYTAKGTSTLTDFPAAVRIREPAREGFSVMTGFEYARAGSDGTLIRFFDSNGDPVEHDVDTWNVRGESVVWARVPSVSTKNDSTQEGATLTMCWRRVGEIKLPDYDPAAVWRGNYMGVWHMAALENGVIRDSSGHGLDAQPKDGAMLEFIDGKAGKAVKLTGTDGCLLAPNPHTAGMTNVTLTYSAWYRDPGFTADEKMTSGYKMFAGTQDYGASTTAEMKTGPGWAMRMNNANNKVTWTCTGHEGEVTIGWNLETTWGYLGSVFGSNAGGLGSRRIYAYNNTFNNYSWEPSYHADGNDRPLMLASGGFEVEEARFSLKAQSEIWTELEYRSLYNEGFCTFGLVIRDGLVCDWWKTEPSLSKTVWKTNETAAVVNNGALQSDAVVVNYTVNLTNATKTVTWPPTAQGSYRISFTHENPEGYRPLVYSIEFYIVDPAQPGPPPGGIGGETGRILLMNADSNEAGPVTNQGWCAKEEAGLTRWRSDWQPAGTNNIMDGINFELVRNSDTNVLWRLYECRQGNTFPTNDNDTSSAEFMAGVYLPRSSSTAKSITNESVAATRSGTGWLMMRNTPNAAVYSSCFTNGIGTIYFDAVNSRPTMTNDFQFAVEIATKTTEGLPPTDENCWAQEADPSKTNYYAKLEGMWRRIGVVAAHCQNNAFIEDIGPTNVVALQETVTGSERHFYRIHAPVREFGPVRFRIVRLTNVAGEGEDSNFILIDNLIVSEPTITADLRPYGEFDPTRMGIEAIGYGGALSVPFPGAGETSIVGRCQLVMPPSFDAGGRKPSEFLSLSQMFYRWRHLDQFRDPAKATGQDWKVASLASDEENAYALKTGALELKTDPGDIEFYFISMVKSPYYKYVDYTGLNLSVSKSGYTDEILTPVRSELKGLENPLPSGGTDWFVRIRDGKSAYEGMRLLTQPSDGRGPVTTNAMEIIGDGIWRTCLRTAHPVAGGLLFRIEGVNPQVAGATEYGHAVNRWRLAGSTRIDAFPQTVDMEACGESDWSPIPCDGTTGYVAFQFDEGRPSLGVAHAEFQTFNTWSTAVDTNGLFTGSSETTNYFPVATGQTNLNWSAWSESIATNSDWAEHFEVGAGERADIPYPKNIPFQSERSRHNWLAENAMWVHGKWCHETWSSDGTTITTMGDDSAVQLFGSNGRLSFVNGASLPAGLENIVLSLRLAQSVEFNDFTLWNKPQADGSQAEDMTDYTFVTFASLSEFGGDDYSGDGIISLVGYYNRERGFYEARFSRGSKDGNIRIRLLRWNKYGEVTDLGYGEVDGGAEPLINANGTYSECGGFFLSVEEYSGSTLVNAGSLRNKVMTLSNVGAMGGRAFSTFSYRDNTPDRLTKGTFGVLSSNCRAVILKPSYYDKGLGSSGSPSAGQTKLTTSKEIAFLGNLKGYPENIANLLVYYDDWVKRPRMTAITSRRNYWGFEAAKDASAQLVMQVAKDAGSPWKTVATNTVTSFADVKETVPICSAADCVVRMLALSGSKAEDVVINGAELRQWRGQETPGLDSSGSYGRYGEFVYTSAWVDRRAPQDDRLTLTLQPARAIDGSSPVSLRGPLLSGVGLFWFSWRNADREAKYHLQIAENDNFNTLRGNLIQYTRETPDGAHWRTIETLDFSELGESGMRTFYVNLRGPTAGVLRLVADRDLTERAIATARSNPNLGRIQITDAYVTDLPAYDGRCWTAWNMRAAGWVNGAPGDWAYIGDGVTGLSGLLNNTLEPSTLAGGNKDYYRYNPPYVQTPVFGTNCIGELVFRARLYEKDADLAVENPAVITLYGATSCDPRTHEPVGWEEVSGGGIVISNRTYATYRVKLKASANYMALRFAVKGVEGVIGGEAPLYRPPSRVALDSICVTELAQPTVRFRNLHVRPFRDSELMKRTAAVPEARITSPDEQPLIGEAFGFQAELEVNMTEKGEIILDDPTHPVTVDLYYYQDDDVWGYENWKNSPNAVGPVRLTAADGTNLVFRSVLSSPKSIASPVAKAKGRTYGITQYHLIAHYYDRSGDLLPHELSAKDWTMPSWYEGFANPNDAAGAKFAAFTVLDDISPGRAWINEVNYVESSQKASKEAQWIELAVPLGVDMTGWEVYLCSFDSATRTTGSRYESGGPLLRLGSGECKNAVRKTESDAPETHYGFLTVGSSAATSVTTDGRWYGLTDTVAIQNGVLDFNRPFGFELRRPSGIVEHRIVTEGYSEAYKDYWYGFQYTGTNLVRVLSAGGERWTFAGKDPLEDGKGLSVTNGQGKIETDWTVAPLTLGGINVGQYIDPNWYLAPNGEYISIYLSCLAPQIRQILGGTTNQYEVVTLLKGGATNIVYEVDNFYELANLTVTSEHALHTLSGPRRENSRNYYDLRIYDVSNRVDVSVGVDIAQDLRRRGVTDANPYKPAIMKWLKDGFTRDAYGNKVPFAGDTVQDFIYRTCNGYDHPTDKITNLTLTVAYWMDVDVTQEGWELRGDMGDTGGGALGPVTGELKRQREGEALIHTNRFGTMWLELTNTVSGVAHSPWRLQGLNNERSDDISTYSGGWSSVTFKVCGRLQNGLVDNVRRPLRYLVFDRNSFRPQDDPKAPFSAWVEVVDPFSMQSPASDWGWAPWGDKPVFMSWGIDDELSPAGVSTMRYEDSLDNYGPVINK